MLYCRKGLSLLPLLFVTQLCAAQLDARPLQKTFPHWQITCNNLNSCEVRSRPAYHGLLLTVVRHAGEDDRPLLRIEEEGGNGDTATDDGLRQRLLLDGQPLPLDPAYWQTRPGLFSSGHGPAIHAFLTRAMDAGRLQGREGTITLNGLQDALSLMDEVQGRSRGESAWARRGGRPAAEVPAAPPLPRVVAPASPPPLTPQETRELLDFASLQASRDRCSLDPQRREVAISPLTADKALLLVSCEMGAYNTIDVAFTVSRQPPYLSRPVMLTLPFLPPGQGERQMELVNAGYDAQSGVLQTFSKNRGLGDCGVVTRWQFNGQRFVLVAYAQQSCSNAGSPHEKWPVLWLSQVAETADARVELQP